MTVVRGTYLMLKAPNIAPYGAIPRTAHAMDKMVSSANDRYPVATPRNAEH